MADLDTTGIDQVIADLRRLPEISEEVLTSAAERIIDTCGRNIAAQVGPDGAPWPPSKDGKPVLVNAKKALSSAVSGTTAVITLSGVEARHHLGAVKGGKKTPLARPILPGAQDRTVLSRAFNLAVADGMEKTVWKAAR